MEFMLGNSNSDYPLFRLQKKVDFYESIGGSKLKLVNSMDYVQNSRLFKSEIQSQTVCLQDRLLVSITELSK